MAVKISDMTVATLPLAGTEEVELNVSLATRKATVQDLADRGPLKRQTVSVLTPAAGVVTINCALGDYFTLAPVANVTSIVFSNLPGAGKGASLMVRFTQDTSARTVAWPASFKWEGGVAGAVSTGSGAIDILAITTFDNGTAWQATLSNARS